MYFIKPQFYHTWHYEFGMQRQVNDSEINQKKYDRKNENVFQIIIFLSNNQVI